MPALPLVARAQEPSCAAPPAAMLAANKAAPAPTKITPAVPNAAVESIPLGADSTLIADIKRGGYVIFFRHAMTNWNERDRTEGDFGSRPNQRNLSEAGQRESALIGLAFKSLEIPIDRVLASPMWRCRDTAEFAFGAYDTTGLLYWKGPEFREARIKMLSTPPPSGKNLVLVGHQDQLIPIVRGLKRDQLHEGDALVFRPLGDGKYRVVTQVTIADWTRLAGVPADPFLDLEETGSMPALPPDSTAGAAKPRVDNR